MECKNGCGAEVDALHMSDEGYFDQRVADCEHRVYDWIDGVHRL